MTILSRQQLKDLRNLTDTFIRKHDAEMGGRGKPRRYDLALVDDFLHRYFREELQREQAIEKHVEGLQRNIDNVIHLRRTGTYGREMVGKGGRL